MPNLKSFFLPKFFLISFLTVFIFQLNFPKFSYAIPNGTGGDIVPLGTDDGDNFNVGTNKLVAEGDTGNVGIGTSIPAQKLHVVGNMRVTLLNCTGNANGGTLTADANGDISCTDDDNGAGSITLQSAYGQDVDGGDATIALTAADDSIILNNPAAAGSDSTFLLRLKQDAIGVVALDIPAANTTADVMTLTANALTTGGMASFTSTSADTATRTLFTISSSSTANSGSTLLSLTQNGGASTGVSLTYGGATGTGILAAGNSLTTGTLTSLTSSSASTATRTLLQVTNSSTASVGTVGIGVSQASGGDAVAITQTANGRSMLITSSATTATAVEVTANSATTGGNAIFSSTSASTATRTLVQITNDDSAAVGTIALKIQQDAGAPALVTTNGNVGIGYTTPGGALTVNGRLGVGNSAPSTDFHVTGGGRITGLVSCDTIDTDANGVLSCGTDANSASSIALQTAYNQDADGSDATIALTTADDSIIFQNPGAGGTDSAFLLRLDQDVATGVVALDIDGENTTSNVVDIQPTVLTTGTALDIGDADALTTGKIANFASNSATTNTRTLVQITNDNSAAVGVTALAIQQDSSGPALTTTNGNVGIGTTAPAAKLEIKQASDAAANGYRVTRSSENTYFDLSIRSGFGAFNDPLVFNTGAGGDIIAFGRTGEAYFKGSVGIGMTAPESILHVKGGDTSKYAKFGTTDWGWRIGELQSGIQFLSMGVKKTAADNNYIAETSDNALVNHRVMELHYDGAVNFLYQAHQSDDATLSLTNQLTLTNGGSVGIGITGPQKALDIRVGTGTSITNPLGEILVNRTNTVGETVGISFGFNNTVSTSGAITLIEKDTTQQSADMAFVTRDSAGGGSTTEKMRITGAGNVGVGYTAPGGALTVSGSVGIGNSAPSTNLHVTGGARITGLVSCDTIDTDANGVLSCGTDGGGGTLQAAYNGDVDGSDVTIALTTADDSIILQNPAAAGTDSAFLLRLDQDVATGVVALDIDGENTTSNVVDIQPTVLTTGTALDIGDADALTTGKIANFASNSATTNTRTLVAVTNSATAAIGVTNLTVTQESKGRGLFIDQNGIGIALDIDTESTTANGVDIQPTVMTTGTALDIGDADALTTGKIANFASNSATTDTRILVQITNDNSAAVGVTALRIQQDSSGPALTTTNGNVGIGTTAPGDVLDVYSTSHAGLRLNRSVDTNIAYLRFGNAGADVAYVGISRNDGTGLITGGTANSLVLRAEAVDTFISNGATPLVTFKSGGNVGIGTTGPNSKIDIISSTEAASTVNDGLGGHLRLSTGTAVTDDSLFFGVNGTSYSWIQAVDPGNTYRPLVLNSEGGNVGIGATDPSAKLHVVGGARITGLVSCDTIDTDANGVLSCGTDTGGSATLQGAYNSDVDGSNTIISLTSADDAFVIQNDDGTNDSGFAMQIDQNDTAGVIAFDIDAENTDADIINISAAPLTTATALDIGDADALTSGKIANFVSNSATTTARTLVQITNDSTGAATTKVLAIQQDSINTSLFIDHNGPTGVALDIDGEQTTANVVDIQPTVLTTGTALDIGGANALTTGKIANFESSSADTATRFLTTITNSSTAAVGATPLLITQESNGVALWIDDNGAAKSTTAVQLESSTQTGKVFNLSTNAITTGVIIDASSDTTMTTGKFANFASSSASTATRTLFAISSSSTANTASTLLGLTQNGGASTGIGLTYGGANGTALGVTGNSLVGGYLANFSSSSTSTAARTLVQIYNSDAGATGATALLVSQAGTSDGSKALSVVYGGDTGIAMSLIGNSLTQGGLAEFTSTSANTAARTLFTISSSSTANSGSTLLSLTQNGGASKGISLTYGGATGTALDIPSADSLTTGKIANFASTSASTATRTLVQITNDDSGAVGATALKIQQDANARAIDVTNGLVHLGSAGLLLPSSTSLPAACSVGQIYMDTDATTGQRLYACETANNWVLEGGSGASTLQAAYGGDVDGSDVTIALTTADDSLILQNPAASGTDSAFLLRLDQDVATGIVALDIDGENTTSNVVDIQPTVLTTGTALDIGDANALTSGKIANFVSNSSDTTARTLVQVTNDHTGAATTKVLGLQQDSLGTSLYIDHNGITGVALDIDGEQTTANVVDIQPTVLTTGTALDIGDADALTSGKIANFASNSASTANLRSLVQITNSATATSNVTALAISQSSSGPAITTTNGNIGFGTTAPSQKLHVIGNMAAVNTGTDAFAYLGEGSNAGEYGWIKWNSGDDTMRIGTQTGSDSVSLTEGGNVGIGYTLPGGMLTVSGNVGIGLSAPTTGFQFTNSNNSAFEIYGSGASSSAAGVGITLKLNDGAALASGDQIAKVLFSGLVDATTYANSAGVVAHAESAWAAGDAPSYIRFDTTPDNTATRTEKMRIASDGNVGIGTTVPGSILHTYKSGTSSIITSETGDAAGTSSYGMYSAKGTGREYRFGVGGAGETLFGLANKFFIYDTTAVANRMVIDTNGNVGIGTTGPKSTLHVSGSFGVVTISKTADYTAAATDHVILVDASGGAVRITLPAASGATGREYQIKKTDASANNVIIDGNASETIDGSTTVSFNAQYQSYMIVCDGSTWWII